jgi:hypothetical protein
MATPSVGRSVVGSYIARCPVASPIRVTDLGRRDMPVAVDALVVGAD